MLPLPSGMPCPIASGGEAVYSFQSVLKTLSRCTSFTVARNSPAYLSLVCVCGLKSLCFLQCVYVLKSLCFLQCVYVLKSLCFLQCVCVWWNHCFLQYVCGLKSLCFLQCVCAEITVFLTVCVCVLKSLCVLQCVCGLKSLCFLQCVCVVWKCMLFFSHPNHSIFLHRLFFMCIMNYRSFVPIL